MVKKEKMLVTILFSIVSIFGLLYIGYYIGFNEVYVDFGENSYKFKEAELPYGYNCYYHDSMFDYCFVFPSYIDEFGNTILDNKELYVYSCRREYNHTCYLINSWLMQEAKDGN